MSGEFMQCQCLLVRPFIVCGIQLQGCTWNIGLQWSSGSSDCTEQVRRYVAHSLASCVVHVAEHNHHQQKDQSNSDELPLAGKHVTMFYIPFQWLHRTLDRYTIGILDNIALSAFVKGMLGI